MVIIKNVIKDIERKFNVVVISVIDSPKSYIISTISPKSTIETSVDTFYSMNKNTGEISEYSPLLDIEEFKKYKDNVIYRKK